MLLALLSLIILGLSYVCYIRRHIDKLPPFPRIPLPLIGNLLSFGTTTRPPFDKWREELGDVYSVYIGSTLVIVLNGYDVIREALVHKADVFTDRPTIFLDKISGYGNCGVSGASGANWKEQRTVSLHILKSFGVGRNSLADRIQEEIEHYLTFLKELNGQPSDIKLGTYMSTSNVICSIIHGQRFQYGDKTFENMIHHMDRAMSLIRVTSLVNFFPVLHYIPGDPCKSRELIVSARKVADILGNQCLKRKHESRSMSSNESDDFITAYFSEAKKRLESGEETLMNDVNLTMTLVDLLVGGTETTSSSILWCLLYIMRHPEAQDKIHEEIDLEIGKTRRPNMADKPRLIYLSATIMETQRLSSIVPYSLAHTCVDQTTLNGYRIPKGAIIVPNLDSVLLDKNVWGSNAEEFDPERFITPSGQLRNYKEFVPFSLGRRMCLGRSMAQMELFLFFSNLFQKFTFLPETPGSPPPMQEILGLVRTPCNFLVRVVDRT